MEKDEELSREEEVSLSAEELSASEVCEDWEEISDEVTEESADDDEDGGDDGDHKEDELEELQCGFWCG